MLSINGNDYKQLINRSYTDGVSHKTSFDRLMPKINGSATTFVGRISSLIFIRRDETIHMAKSSQFILSDEVKHSKPKNERSMICDSRQNRRTSSGTIK